MRFAFRSALLAVFLLSAFPVVIQAELDCTDFLTFSNPGNSKLPADAFDYNTSVPVLRIASGRVDSFAFPDSTKGYFLVATAPYAPRNVTAGRVLYQYTEGASEFYFRVLNGSVIPWRCGPDKMADLVVGMKELSGTFYSATGEKLVASEVSAVMLDAGIENGFLVPGFGTARKVYVAAQANVSGVAVGYLVHDAGNSTFVATGYKQARFHVPAAAVPFCNDWKFLCMDASGIKVPACRGAGFHSYFCSGNICVTNLTACPNGCQNAVCLEPMASVLATITAPVASVAPSVGTPTVAPTSPLPTATPTVMSVQPAASKPGGVDPVLLVVVLLALVAGAYYFLVLARRPKGL